MAAGKQRLKTIDFVHLHNHTQYSLLDGLTKVPGLMDYVHESGMSAVAITDHGTLSGLVEFYKQATAKNIKPVLGMEAYIAPRSLHDRDPTKDKKYYHLILLAKDNTGYQNLMRLSSIANLQGFYYKPRIDRETLAKYQEGLIVLSGCIGGEVGDALRQNQYEQAKKTAEWYKGVFGDRYYLEVQDHGHPDHPSPWAEQVEVTQKTLRLSKELDIPCVLTCDAHYLQLADQEAHEILLCVQTGSFLSDEKRMSLKNFHLNVTDPKEVIKRWGSEHPELIKNTKLIADRCGVTLDLGKILIPKFPVPKGETEKTYLHKLVYCGLARRYGGEDEVSSLKLSQSAAKKLLSKEVLERAMYELGVIDSMSFNGYFLIVRDFIIWGKDRDIVFGPGRGSGASSIVAYALRITELDPLAYDLMFERFLNPDRISMPDFDIDIQDNRRDEVIQYCVEKYGEDRVANIVTFGRMAARNAVRDVARVLQVPYADADRLAKMIPPPVQGRHIPLAASIKKDRDLKKEYAENEQSKRVFDLAVQLEGTIRSHGVHAAGVVIAPDEIVKFTPLEKAQKGVVATQYSMGPIEDLGLLKIDFLGLSNLTTIKNAIRIIKKVYHTDIDINDIPLDDTKTYELLQRGETAGVFQLESAGMKRFLKELVPNQFDDIIAMVALYRPGPMAEFPRFIAGKKNANTIHYPHASLEPILKNTYGVMVFQEQIIALLQLLAGYSPGEADLIRKAIGKKQRDIMEAEHPRFISGCKKQGLSEQEAEKIWTLIQPFADYSFNKAHAACYAMIAYQTAFLKANYPPAFMAALMSSDFDDTDRLAIEISECKNMGIEVLPPDINESFVEFAVVPGTNQIRFGLAAIKNVGTAAVEEILKARELGRFEDIEQFFRTVNPRIVNRKTLESLIKAGAFDSFGKRNHLLHNLDVITAFSSRIHKQASSGQVDLFGDKEISNPGGSLTLQVLDNEPDNNQEQLQWERDLLGLYLSQHPLMAYESILAEKSVPISSLKPEHNNKTVSVGGMISEVREITTKNGQKMAFIKLADLADEIELILFPGAYQDPLIWQRDNVVLAKGKVSSQDKQGNNDELKVLVNEARTISHDEAIKFTATGKKPALPKSKQPIKSEAMTPEIAHVNPRLYIRMLSSEDHEILQSLKRTIDSHKGSTEVVLVVGPEPSKQIIRLPMRITANDQSISRLKELVGDTNVKVH